MSFSNEWDDRYREGSHMSEWPWSDLVSYVYRFARPTSPAFRVLELGCGAGANIPFFKSFGLQYFAVEGSPAIVARLHQRFPEYRETIVVADFTRALPFTGAFDLIVDRSSLTCNTTKAIEGSLKMVRERLKPGGAFIGIDWFSTEHTAYATGTEDGDAFTRRDFKSEYFNGLGRIHFSNREHLLDVFRDFDVVAMEHRAVRREIPKENGVIAAWNIAARRRAT